MKINKLTLILLLVFVLLFFPNYSDAETRKIEYTSIEKTSTLNIGTLYFSPINFRNFSNTSEIFGLAGIVQNNGSSAQNFIATADFYDGNYNLIATLESNQYVPANEKNSYSNVGNISKIKSGYTADDIKYYSLTVNTNNVYASTNTNLNNTSSTYNSNKYDYVINDYKIDMVVNENNTFDITETIKAYFNTSKHGIFRKIPLKNNVTRLDGTKSNNRAQITNITVNEDYTTSNENGYKVIKIGDANTTITGSHTYIIKYNYNIGKDPLKNVDELYYNLIGDEWDTIIENVSFNITMPKSFDESLLGFSSGNVGSTNSSNVKYSVIGNTITGTVDTVLAPGQALTVRLTLPDEYFIGAGQPMDKFSVFVIVMCLAFILIAYSLWAKYGKDDQLVETVEFYPPENYNSAEVGFLYEGSASNESIISLLIYLANKGYLKIEETEEKMLFFNSKGFRITKLKEYDGNNECERIFFNGLFKGASAGTVNMSKAKQIMQEAKLHGEKISFKDALELSMETGGTKDSVTDSDLYNSFYTTLNRIKSKMNSKENKHKIFESTASGKGKWLILMIIAVFVLITVKPILEYGEGGLAMLPFALIFPGIGFTVLFKMVFGKTNSTVYVNGRPSKSPLAPKIFGLVWGGMFGGMPWAFIVLPCLLQNTFYLITYILGIICIAILVIFKNIMPKRTPYGNEILGKLKGFKRFLETAEKPQLESLVMQNPEYFYNILPYTYALGISDKWINQFETIALQAPNWYGSHSAFSVHSFGTFMNSTMNSATTAMSSSPSSSRGGSSGGGSSGGGSGGGGGGSW